MPRTPSRILPTIEQGGVDALLALADRMNVKAEWLAERGADALAELDRTTADMLRGRYLDLAWS